MLEKITFLTALYVLLFVSDMRKLKKASRSGKWSYTLIVIGTLYFSVDYLLDVHWPDVNWLAERVLLVPSEAIVESLKVKHAG